MGFHVLGIDILAGRQHDDVLLTSDDVQMPLRVKVSQIAGAEPPISSERLAISLRVSIIARHYDIATNQNFTDTFAIRPINLDLDMIQRPADRLRLRTYAVKNFLVKKIPKAGHASDGRHAAFF